MRVRRCRARAPVRGSGTGQALENPVPAMTRYSRSVLPGRHPDQAPQDNPGFERPGLDRMVFGGRAGSRPAAANDGDEPDFLPPMPEDEADLLAGRANPDRRKSPDRRTQLNADRRSKQQPGRRASEYKPLRDDAGRRAHADEGKRGPLLLIGALLIVVVFGVVVWNAYRDGLQSDEVEVAPELSTAGSFKTPPRVVEPAPIVAEPALELPLDGPPTPVETNDEVRPAPPAVATPAAATPAPSKYTAPPPPALKQPAPAPVQTATVPAVQQPAPKPVAAAPKPAAAAPAAAPASGAPAFAAGANVVQIAATATEAAANAEWTKLLKAYPDMLSGGEKFIQQADVNGKTVYRLRVGSFATKADASAFCAAFKARGGNCYPAVK